MGVARHRCGEGKRRTVGVARTEAEPNLHESGCGHTEWVESGAGL